MMNIKGNTRKCRNEKGEIKEKAKKMCKKIFCFINLIYFVRTFSATSFIITFELAANSAEASKHICPLSINGVN